MFFGHDRQQALVTYRQRHDNDPTDAKAVLGCMKCLDAMGEWDELVKLCTSSWHTLEKPGDDTVSFRKAATLAARYEGWGVPWRCMSTGFLWWCS